MSNTEGEQLVLVFHASPTTPFKSFDCLHFFIKVIHTFTKQGCNKLIKSDSEDIHNITKRFPFHINAVLLSNLFIKET